MNVRRTSGLDRLRALRREVKNYRDNNNVPFELPPLNRGSEREWKNLNRDMRITHAITHRQNQIQIIRNDMQREPPVEDLEILMQRYPPGAYNVYANVVLQNQEGKTKAPYIHSIVETTTYKYGYELQRMMRRKYRREHNMHESNNEFLGYFDPHFEVLDQEGGLMDQYLQRTDMQYKIIQADNAVIHEGYCVIDLIMNAFSSKSRVKVYRNEIIKEISPNAEKGIKGKELIAWVEKRKDISLTLLNPLLKVVYIKSVTQPNATIYAIINNNHVYPINIDSLRKSIQKTNRLILGENSLSHYPMNDIAYFPEDEMKQAVDSSARVVFYETADLSELLGEIQKMDKFITTNIYADRANIAAFERPKTNQIYVAAPDYHQRKHVADTMREKYTKFFPYVWRNQTWAQLAKSIFSQHISFPESQYSKDLMDVMEKTLTPYIAMTSQPFDITKAKSFDIRRCYTKILRDNEYNYPIFTEWDKVVKAEYSEISQLTQASEYYINEKIKLGNNTIILQNGWYPYIIVKYALDKGVIGLDNIIYAIHASSNLPHDTFKSPINYILNKFPNESKNLINTYIGQLGKGKIRGQKIAITDSKDIAFGMYVENENITVHNVGKFFMIREQYSRDMYRGSKPIHRHVIAASYIALDKLHDAVVADDAVTVVGYNTDSIKVIGSNFVPEQLDDVHIKKKLGTYTEEKRVIVKGEYFETLATQENNVIPTFAKTWRKFDLEDDDIIFYSGISCCVTGMPGSGKTTLLAKIYKEIMEEKEEVVALSFTNASKGVMIDNGVPAVTFDSFLNKNMTNAQKIEKLASQNTIIVDEFTMVPKRFYFLLFQAKMRNPKLKIIAFGDEDQLGAVEKNKKNCSDYSINYVEESLFMWLCGYNHHRLRYIEKAARYDRPLYDALMTLKQDNIIPNVFSKPFPPEKAEYNICKLVSTCDVINKRWFRHRSNGKQIVSVTVADEEEEFDIFVGMPVWSHTNKFKLVNSCRYFIHEITSENIILSSGENELYTVPREQFTQFCSDNRNGNFSYGWAITAHRSQGKTFEGNYNVFDSSAMSKNMIYVALSRARHLKNIGVNHTDKVYKSQDFRRPRYTENIEPQETKTCEIKGSDEELLEISYINDYDKQLAEEYYSMENTGIVVVQVQKIENITKNHPEYYAIVPTFDKRQNRWMVRCVRKGKKISATFSKAKYGSVDAAEKAAYDYISSL